MPAVATPLRHADGSAATTRRLGNETPPRRRIADTSVVLTEDTDSFIIGDRVWVGGTKPGKIAYIGATQFAPGEWAGVVLDDPVGKNDGSVAGIRYFQCEARRGVFSRLTRLTRAPLPAESPLGVLGANGSVSGASSPSRAHSAIVSPASSINNLSQRGGKSSAGGYKVGDRVIVMSSMGSKAGVLRYLGTTDFATGEWCGVELDDPLGKNDGAVAGRRYFECQPKFGLFAPSHKVSKSPSSRRPSAACALHHPNSAQNSNLPVMKRGGSRESLASSVASSAVSSVRGARVRLGVTSLQKTGVRTPTNPAATRASLQDTLKEKDAHIERLLQERKLDRAEVIRAATRLEEAESKLSLLKQEFDKCQGNADTKLREMQDLLARVHQEKADLATQLDDEKRKIEDLQFRFEEERITKGDIEVTSVEQAENIARLEAALVTERARADASERDATALFEAEESAARLREERERLAATLREVEAARDAAAHAHAADAEALRKQLQHAGDGANALAAAATKADHEHRAAIETLLNEKEAIRSELTSQLKETIASHTEEMTQSRKQLKEIEESLNAQLNASSQRCTGLEDQLASIVKQFEDAQNIIRLKSDDLEKGSEATKAIETLLKSQVEETRYALSITTEELQKVKNASLEKDQQLDQLKTTLAKAENDMKAKSQELDTLIESTEKQLAEIHMKAEETQMLLCQKSEELNLTSKASDEKIAQKNDTLHKMEEKCKVQEVEIAELQQKLKELKENYEMIEQETQTTRVKILEERNAKLNQLEAAMSEKDIIVMKLQNELTQQSKETKEKDSLISKHTEELSGLNEKLGSVEAARSTLHENVQHLELEVGDLKRNLKAAEEKVMEANAQKQKLEQDICELMSTSSDSSLQLNKLNSELREKEHELEKVKEQTSVSIREKETVCQKLEQTIEQATRAQRELEEQIEQIKKEAKEAERTATEKLKDASVIQQQLEEQLMENQKKINTLELESREQLIKVDQEFEAAKEEFAKKTQKSHENYQELEQQLSKLRKEVTAREAELNQEIAVLSEKLQSAEEDMKEKSSKLSLSEEEMKTKVEKMLEVGKKLEENLKHSHQLEIEALKLQLVSVENAMLEKDEKMSSITDELLKLKQEKDLLESTLVEKDSKLIDILKQQQKINELKSLADSTLLEKSRDIDNLTNDLNKEKLKSADLEKQIINSHDKQKILEQELEDTKAEKCRMENLIKTTETELSKVSEEFTILKEAHSSSSLSSSENEAKLRNLMQEVADLTKEKVSVEEKLRETSEMLVDATTQLAALAEEKVLLLKVSEELDNLKITFDQHKNKLSGQLQETKKEAELVPLLQESLEKEKEKSNELETKLSLISKVHSELSDRCIQLEKSACTLPTVESQVSRLEKELEKVLKREDESKKLYDCEKAELLETLEAVQNLLSQKENENQAQKLESIRLAEEIAKAQQYKTVLEKLENEKDELKQKVSKITVSAAESQANANSSDSSYVKLIEEKELAQSQIDFLNSVIVDMQQKNVALKTRLEVLEMGILPSDADDLIEEGITKRVIAPRLFCDICGEFDLHDTEDCPRQATESPTPPTNNSKHAVGARSNIQERPYCEICETFGHSTEDCDDAETF